MLSTKFIVYQLLFFVPNQCLHFRSDQYIQKIQEKDTYSKEEIFL